MGLRRALAAVLADSSVEVGPPVVVGEEFAGAVLKGFSIRQQRLQVVPGGLAEAGWVGIPVVVDAAPVGGRADGDASSCGMVCS